MRPALRSSLCLLFALALCCANVRSLHAGGEAGQPGGYLRAGVGARSAALGNAYVALAEGPEAGYWNAAGLAWERRPAFSSMVSSLSLNRQFSYFGLGLAWDKDGDTLNAQRAQQFKVSNAWGTWSGGWINFSLGNDFEGRASDTAKFYVFGDQQNAYLLSHGRALTPWLAVGGTLKVLDRRLDTFSASGWGADLGTTLLLGSQFRLSVQAQDLGTKLTWSTGYEERFPVTLRVGLAGWTWKDRLMATAQLEQVEGRQPSPSVGIEGTVASVLKGRLGWQKDGLTLGGGLLVALAGLKGSLDYAYLPDPLQQGVTQRLSVGVSF
jgi:hypothetical protein